MVTAVKVRAGSRSGRRIWTAGLRPAATGFSGSKSAAGCSSLTWRTPSGVDTPRRTV